MGFPLLLLVPRALLSGPAEADFDHYIHDAHRQYQYLLDSRGELDPSWGADTPGSSTHSYDSRPEADLPSDKTEGDATRLLTTLLTLLSNMSKQPYRVNLELTAVVSRLALLPRARLLTPDGPLLSTLRELAASLAREIPALKNYRQLIDSTRKLLMTEDFHLDGRDHNPLIECLIVLEEFCKELAAIAFVKYHHAAQVAAYNKSNCFSAQGTPVIDSAMEIPST